MKKKLLMIMLNKRNNKVEIREDENVKEDILNLYI